MADTVRTLAVVLTSKISDYQKGLKNAERSVDGLEKRFAGLSGTLKSVGTGVGIAFAGAAAVVSGVAGALAYAAKQTADYADQIGTLAERSGHSTEFLQQLAYAAGQTGTSLEQVAKGSQLLQRNLADGTKETTEAIDALGLSFETIRAAEPDKQFKEVLSAIGKVEDPTQRTALAMRLLGRSGAELIPLSGQIDDLTEKAQRLGLVLSDDDVKAAKQLGESVATLGDTMDGLVRNVGAVITSNESLHVLVEGLADVLASLSGVVADNRDALSSLVSEGVIVLAKGMLFAVDAAQLGMDVWDGLRLTWASLYDVARDLALVVERVNLAYLRAGAGTQQEIQASEQRIALYQAEIDANARHASEIVQGNADRTNAIQTLRSQLSGLVKDVEAAAGQERKAGAVSRDLAGDVRLLSDAEDQAAKAAQRAAEQFAKAVETQRRAISGAFDPAEVQVFSTALSSLGGAGDVVGPQLEAIAIKILDMKAAGETLPPIADEIVERWIRLNNAETEIDAFNATLAKLGPTAEQVSAEFDQLVAVVERLGIEALSDQQLAAYVAEMEKLADAGRLTTDQFLKLGEAYDSQLARGAIPTTATLTEQTQDWGQSLEDISNLVEALPGKLGDIGQAFAGVTAGISGLFTSLDKVGKGKGLEGLLGSISGIGGAVSAAIGIASSIGGVVSGLFKGAQEEVNDLRDDFFEAEGGFESFSRKMASVSDEDWAKKIFDAKTVEEFNALVKEAKGLLDTQGEAQEALRVATEKYGFTIEELGPAMQRQELDRQAGELLQDFKLLTASGIDVNTVIAKMGPNLLEFVDTARSTGQAIPEAMRPLIDQLIASGQLVDENGNAFESAEDAGITFAQTMSEQFATLIDRIDQFVTALTGIKPPAINIPVNYTQGSQPTPPGRPSYQTPDIPEFAAGGIVRMPTLAVVGEAGPEAILPLDALQGLLDVGGAAGGGDEYNLSLSVAMNPLQTHETVEQTTDYLVDRVQHALAGSLAELVASGKA